MAARTPRRSFAAPFVVTLAAVPACYVQTGTPPNQPPPPPPPQTEPQSPPPQQPGGPVVVTNPPRPTPAPQQPDPPPPQPTPPQPTPPQKPTTPPPQPTTPTTTTDTRWTVYKSQDGCMAAIKVECQPKATCNPPPPFKIACPADVNLDKPVTVVSQDGGSTCMVEFPMPKCPPNVACNPPRPRRVECPKR